MNLPSFVFCCRTNENIEDVFTCASWKPPPEKLYCVLWFSEGYRQGFYIANINPVNGIKADSRVPAEHLCIETRE